jgi:hypothetical protein
VESSIDHFPLRPWPRPLPLCLLLYYNILLPVWLALEDGGNPGRSKVSSRWGGGTLVINERRGRHLPTWWPRQQR